MCTNNRMCMTWSWFERANENETDWIERLERKEDRPTFEELSTAASNLINKAGGRLVISTYDPYTGDTYTNHVRIDSINDSKIVGSDGQTLIFVLPDLTAGHFDTQGGTERMPDIVLDYDVEER